MKYFLLGLMISSIQHYHIQTVEVRQKHYARVTFSEILSHNQFQTSAVSLNSFHIHLSTVINTNISASTVTVNVFSSTSVCFTK